MRRLPLLLVALVAAAVPVTPSHAAPLCAHGEVHTAATGTVDLGTACMPTPYGTFCDSMQAGAAPLASVFVSACVPSPI